MICFRVPERCFPLLVMMVIGGGCCIDRLRSEWAVFVLEAIV